jgi:hypothetical protein
MIRLDDSEEGWDTQGRIGFPFDNISVRLNLEWFARNLSHLTADGGRPADKDQTWTER